MNALNDTIGTEQAASEARLNIPSGAVTVGDQMDCALHKLRTIALALTPDNRGWQDEASLTSVWATLDQAISDLEPVRNRLQGVEGGCSSEVKVAEDAGKTKGSETPRHPTLSVETDALSRMSIEELGSLRSVLRSLNEMVFAFGSQPRFQSTQSDSVFNAPGVIIDEITEFLDWYVDAADHAIESADPGDLGGVELQIWLRLNAKTEGRGNIADVADLSRTALRYFEIAAGKNGRAT